MGFIKGKQKKFLLWPALALLLLLLFASGSRQRQEALAGRIAPHILRLHILADSDRTKDQEVKLEVRSLVLDFLREHMNSADNKEEAKNCLKKHTGELTDQIHTLLEKRGMPYGAKIQLETCYFPPRTYGSLTLPQGQYDAVRILLGSGKGHNWWCVVYPGLCLSSGAVSVPEESLSYLRQCLNRDDYLALANHHPDFQIRFQWLSFLNP